MKKDFNKKYTFSFIAPSNVIEEIKSDMRFSTFVKVSETSNIFRPSIQMRFWCGSGEHCSMDVIGYDKKAMEDVHEFIKRNEAVVETTDITATDASKTIYW